MAEEADLLRTIGQVYEAVTSPAEMSGLARHVADGFSSDRAMVYTVLKPGAVNKHLLSTTPHFDDYAHVSYTTHFQMRDELSRRAVRKPTPLVMINHEIMDADDFRRSEIYSDYFRGLGAFHFLCGLFPIKGDLLGVLSVQRPETGIEFSEEERLRMTQLMPHLQRAVQIRHRLMVSEQDSTLTLEVLDRLALGAIIVDDKAKVVFANTVAERLLQAGQGLTQVEGRLRATGIERGPELARMISEAAQTGAGKGAHCGGLVVISRAEGASLSLMVSPFRSVALGCGPAVPTALVMFSDPAATTNIPEHILARVLGLAHAEAKLLAALVAGQTMGDYAETAGITINTAKTQLRQIFLKTGHNRQADVIRAVLADPLMKMVAGNDEGAPAA